MASRARLDDIQLAFLAAARTAVLATTGPSGRPRLVPICFAVGGAESGAAPRLHSPLDDKPKRSADPRDLARARDVLARPEATLLVDRWSEDWDRLGWLRLDVRATLIEPDGDDGPEHASAVGALRAKYSQYAAHRLESRPILRFEIVDAVAWGSLDPGVRGDAAISAGAIE